MENYANYEITKLLGCKPGANYENYANYEIINFTTHLAELLPPIVYISIHS